MQRSEAWDAVSVRQQLHDSLRALNTDHIDIYQFHSGTDEVFNNYKLWEMLRAEQRKGTIGHLGVSLSKTAPSDHQISRAADLGISVVQVKYNRLNRRAEDMVFPHRSAQSFGVIARSVLEGGLLSGKYSADTVFTGRDIRATRKQSEHSHLITQALVLAETEKPPDMPGAQWALQWCLRNSAVDTVIAGCKNPQQVYDNAAAALPAPCCTAQELQ
jgi:aryl-alcohol dehydrogenase-like predicted oxidoreductase